MVRRVVISLITTLRINPIRAEALGLTKRTSISYFNGWGVLPSVRRLAIDYEADVRGRKIVLDNEEEKKCLVLAYKTRFSTSYVDETRKAILNLPKHSDAVHVVLTIDPNNFYSLYSAYRGLMVAWNRLHSFIVKRLGWHPYFRILEFQLYGQPHLHILFFDIKWLMPFLKLKELWIKYNIGLHVSLRRVWNRVNLQKYMMKYLTKSLVGSQVWDRELSTKLCGYVLAWALNARVVSFSLLKRTIRLIQTSKLHLFIYRGSFHANWFEGLHTGAERYLILDEIDSYRGSTPIVVKDFL